jgi:hypothetical protein
MEVIKNFVNLIFGYTNTSIADGDLNDEFIGISLY